MVLFLQEAAPLTTLTGSPAVLLLSRDHKQQPRSFFLTDALGVTVGGSDLRGDRVAVVASSRWDVRR